MIRETPEAFRGLRGGLIVSCQAWEDDPFHGAEHMARFARAAVAGGAVAIRANSPGDIQAIREAVPVPILGIQKRVMPDGAILITPAFEDAARLVEAGAAAVALDCTARGQSYGALGRLRRIKQELRTVVTADIATVEEAIAAADAGADFVLSTLRGYTVETAHVTSFEPEFIAQLVRAVPVPVIAEGRIGTAEEARAALRAGAFAVVVGSAITRPRDVAAHFAAALRSWSEAQQGCLLGIDLGGTAIKSGLVTVRGELSGTAAEATLTTGGREGLLRQLAAIAQRLKAAAEAQGLRPAALGVASAGWIDARSGSVVYGTANLPDWTGAPVGASLADELGLRVFVENDANAQAMGEKYFGAASEARDFLCITLGTGVGAGCYTGGRLNRGAHSMANALGHLTVETGGLGCTCGRRGCLEQYANLAALRRYAAEVGTREAIRKIAEYLARGFTAAIELLDPELIVLTGGLAQENPQVVDDLSEALDRRVEVRLSSLGYYGGVAGAAAVAVDRLA